MPRPSSFRVPLPCPFQTQLEWRLAFPQIHPSIELSSRALSWHRSLVGNTLRDHPTKSTTIKMLSRRCRRLPTLLLLTLVAVTEWYQGAMALLSRPFHPGSEPGPRRTDIARDMAATEAALASLAPLLESKELAEDLAGKRVALYFSAGWCPMCTSFEPALQRFAQAADDAGTPVALIYVPSDRSEAEAVARAGALGMPCVPFEEARKCKKTFGVWSGSEMMNLGFQGRRSGVPALVVLDPADGTELAFVPAESQGVRALAGWPLDQGVW